MKYRFHILGIPHTATNKHYVSCFSPDTDLMTEDGWRNIKELVESNAQIKIATLNPVKNSVEYHFPDQWIINDYSGKMFYQGNSSVNLLVTPEHNLWVRLQGSSNFQFIEAQHCPRKVEYDKNFPWEGQHEEFFTIPEYRNNNTKTRPARIIKMDDWLRFFGAYITEGSIDGTSYSRSDEQIVKGKHVVNIAQEKSESREKFRHWIEACDFKYIEDEKGFRICDVQLASYLSQFGKAREKYIPKLLKNLSKRQLGLLLDAMILGDGWKYKTGIRYVSFSMKLADDTNEIATKIGFKVTQYDDPDPLVPRHILTISNYRMTPLVNNKTDNREWVSYDGKVYCLQVKNHLVYARRKGRPCWVGQCAYTQKVLKLCEMLTVAGHEVYHYGCEGSDPVCTEHISIVTEEQRKQFYPDDFTEFYKFDINDAFHQTFHENAYNEIQRRGQQKDFLLCQWGFGHKPVADRVEGQMMAVESGIGYDCTFASFRVFESYTWMNWVYGKDKVSQGSWYDSVIPNYFDVRDFTYNDKKENWFLYIGRLINLKGIDVANQVCKELGAKLIIAGQGKLVNPAEKLDLTGDHIEFVGHADVNRRKELMSKAKAVFVPTYYIEPFGGVSIEAMLSGTPVITTDWGVFSENVLHGINGYRCRTFEQFLWAAQNTDKLSSAACRDWAVNNFSMARVTKMYEEYFDMLYNLWDEGWYKKNPNRTNLDWLRRYYPGTGDGPPVQSSAPVPVAPKVLATPRIIGPVPQVSIKHHDIRETQ